MPTFSCSACKRAFDEVAWSRLPLVDRIEAPAVRRFVSIWPEGVCVEVRRCDDCGQSIAAKRPAGAATASELQHDPVPGSTR